MSLQRSIESFGDVAALRSDLATSLLPHQQRSVAAATQRRRILIADEMGLGKTRTALTALEEIGEYPAVILTPASAEVGLLRECLTWLPWRSAGICTDTVPASEIIILHPEVLRRHRLELIRRGIKSVVLDESHFYKNPGSERSRLAEELANRCGVRILLSGTPIKNRRTDLVNQLRILGCYDAVMMAAYKHAGLTIPAKAQNGGRPWSITSLPAGALHRALEETVMVRTTHTKAGTGLVPVNRVEVQCPEAASDEYRALEDQFIAYCKEVSLLDPECTEERAQARIRAAKILNDMRAALGAAKLDQVQKWALQIKGQGRKGVVFTYHRAVADQLASRLPGRVASITGATPKKQRQRVIDGMSACDFLTATMDTMSHAINGLQQHAQDLVFVELDHTHSKHEQAEGRLRRHGQKNAVTATYLVAPNTCDEALLSGLALKWKDAAGVIDGTRAARNINFAELVLSNVIQQRPWETGKPIDWKAAATQTRIQKGNSVSKPGRNGPMVGQVIWVNSGMTSCRVEWPGGLVTFEVPGHLRVVDA